MARLWQPRETRLLSEWVHFEFPNDVVRFRVRLGGLPSWAVESVARGAPAAIYKIYQRWADAIILREKETIIVEAKIIADPGVISQIKLYARLLPKTLDFQEIKDLPIRKIILMGMIDREIEDMATDEEIEVYIYSPPWVTAYLKEIKRYRERY